jgi:hypothetical protein
VSYFLITSGEDGISVEQLSDSEILRRIATRDGTTYYGRDLTFLSDVPASDKGHWYDVPENSVLIIKGEVVVPKPVTEVLKYEL